MMKPQRGHKPRIAVHKFSSCDGCQLAFLNMGEKLLELAGLVDIVHFAEAGVIGDDIPVDIAFVEGSVSTPNEAARIHRIRANTAYLIPIGACATAGGIQSLRNLHDKDEWASAIYANPGYIESLATSTPISEHVRPDLELWGCPVNSHQIVAAIRALLNGVVPVDARDKVCLDCKRRQNVCVMVAKGIPCMGPVTRTGCGALCPSVGRDCYACYGPAENVNTASLGRWFRGLGLNPRQVADRFQFINGWAPPFKNEAQRWREQCDE